MEPANIDWKNIESKFEEDEIYEHINAPKWIDFSAPDHHVDDEAWFCKPECKHPKTVDDFIKSTPPTPPSAKMKQMRSANASENLPLRSRNLRDGTIKRGGILTASSNVQTNEKKLIKSKTYKQEDQENENPNNTNSSSSSNHQQKNSVKPLMEKRKPFEKAKELPKEEERRPKLKSTLSASNLFAGKEIMSHITEFCSELKKLVMRAKEREKSKKRSPKKKLSEGSVDDSQGDLEEKEENKPLLEVEKGISEVVKKSNEKENQRKLKTGNIENIQPLKVTGNGQGENLLPVRTCPPSPQCFSNYREPLRRPKTTTTPLKSSKSILAEKSILQEVEKSNRVVETESSPANRKNISVATKEVRSLEMFWLLKPCTATVDN